MNLALYILKNTAIIPTQSRTQAGYYLETEPVDCLELTDPGLPEILERAFRRGNPVVPTPTAPNFPKPVVLQYANMKTWGQFAARAELWSIEDGDGVYMIGRATKDGRGGYGGGHDKVAVPIDTTGGRSDFEQIVEIVRSGTRRAGARPSPTKRG